MPCRPMTIDIDPAAVDADGIAESQTPSGAGNFTLDGNLGTSLLYATQLLFTTVDDESGDTYTVTGTDQDGNVITEDVTGPNNTTAETTKYFKTITSIATDGAATAAITIGTVDEVITQAIPLDHYEEHPATVSVVVTGTINYTVQETFDDIQVVDKSNINWVSVTALASKTATLNAELTRRATAMRVIVNSYSTGAELQVRVLQG